ncbi:MAG TPA: hypothetical protein IAC03_08155 [Candidatus Coprenecus pullistercoris]|nr:hypothetical protein [Candidatus Coprenecus pullistercoris]
MKKTSLLDRAAFAAMLLCAFFMTAACQKPQEEEKPDDNTEEPVVNPDDEDDDNEEPDTPVVPDRPEMTGLTFDISVEPGVVSAVLDIVPSDPEAHYYAQVLDAAWFTEYTDQAMIELICQDFGANLSAACVTGSILDYQVTNIMPSTDYFVVAFGVDTSYNTYNSLMTKVQFKTLDNQPTEAYAPFSIAGYWLVEDLAAYNPEYASLKDSDSTVIAAIDVDFSDEAVMAHYVTYIGDETGSDPELLIHEILYYGMTFGYTIMKEQPVELIYRGFGYPMTVCTVALDAAGNYGELYRTLVTFTEDGVSKDFALFDEYFSKKSDKRIGIN